MRKVAFLLVALVATMLCTSSCGDDNDSNILEGTTWVTEDEGEITVLKFQKTTVNVSYQYDENGDGVITSDEIDYDPVGTYILDGNNVIITVEGATTTGTISGNKMVLGGDDDPITFTKQ